MVLSGPLTSSNNQRLIIPRNPSNLQTIQLSYCTVITCCCQYQVNKRWHLKTVVCVTRWRHSLCWYIFIFVVIFRLAYSTHLLPANVQSEMPQRQLNIQDLSWPDLQKLFTMVLTHPVKHWHDSFMKGSLTFEHHWHFLLLFLPPQLPAQWGPPACLRHRFHPPLCCQPAGQF